MSLKETLKNAAKKAAPIVAAATVALGAGANAQENEDRPLETNETPVELKDRTLDVKELSPEVKNALISKRGR